jgi:hypothetical protein
MGISVEAKGWQGIQAERRTLMLRKVRSHRFGRNAGFIRQDVKLFGFAAA